MSWAADFMPAAIVGYWRSMSVIAITATSSNLLAACRAGAIVGAGGGASGDTPILVGGASAIMGEGAAVGAGASGAPSRSSTFLRHAFACTSVSLPRVGGARVWSPCSQSAYCRMYCLAATLGVFPIMRSRGVRASVPFRARRATASSCSSRSLTHTRKASVMEPAGGATNITSSPRPASRKALFRKLARCCGCGMPFSVAVAMPAPFANLFRAFTRSFASVRRSSSVYWLKRGGTNCPPLSASSIAARKARHTLRWSVFRASQACDAKSGQFGSLRKVLRIPVISPTAASVKRRSSLIASASQPTGVVSPVRAT